MTKSIKAQVGLHSTATVTVERAPQISQKNTRAKHDQTIMEILESESFLGFPPSSTRVVTKPYHSKPFGNE
jgi:hypothetical protein